jgi:hypothetical protein
VEFRSFLAIIGVIFAVATSMGAISAAGRYAPTPGAYVSDSWPNAAVSRDDIWPNGGFASDIWPNMTVRSIGDDA